VCRMGIVRILFVKFRVVVSGCQAASRCIYTQTHQLNVSTTLTTKLALSSAGLQGCLCLLRPLVNLTLYILDTRHTGPAVT
jgi:hypothetical protein